MKKLSEELRNAKEKFDHEKVKLHKSLEDINKGDKVNVDV